MPLPNQVYRLLVLTTHDFKHYILLYCSAFLLQSLFRETSLQEFGDGSSLRVFQKGALRRVSGAC